jgi:UDP-glucose 4-epimerase
MKKYLVTGAAGFIGSTLAKVLLNQGHEVWTIDNLTTGRKENLPQGVKFIHGGCQDAASIAQLKDTRFDAILHIAGQSSGEVSFDDPVYDLRTNTESTLRLIQYGLSHDCPRFIYASSMSVYGEVPDQPIPETFPCRPLSFYGVGKLASEHYMRIYQSKGLKPTSLRYFNVYGENQNMANLRQGMVSIYLAQLIKNDEVIVKGSKDRFRDLISIKDAVDFTVKIIDDERSFGGIFNVATGVRTTVEQLLEKLIRLSGIKKRIVFAEGTPGDQRGIYADMSLLKKTFDFQCRVPLDEGLEKMIAWAEKTAW